MSIASMFLDSHRGSAELSGGEIDGYCTIEVSQPVQYRIVCNPPVGTDFSEDAIPTLSAFDIDTPRQHHDPPNGSIGVVVRLRGRSSIFMPVRRSVAPPAGLIWALITQNRIRWNYMVTDGEDIYSICARPSCHTPDDLYELVIYRCTCVGLIRGYVIINGDWYNIIEGGKDSVINAIHQIEFHPGITSPVGITMRAAAIEHMNNEGLASVVVDRMGNKVDITPVVGEGRGWHPAKLRPSSEVSAMVNHEAGWLYVCKNY